MYHLRPLFFTYVFWRSLSITIAALSLFKRLMTVPCDLYCTSSLLLLLLGWYPTVYKHAHDDID